jgi:hypothetical protein
VSELLRQVGMRVASGRRVQLLLLDCLKNARQSFIAISG